MPKHISIAISPCPNDTYIFGAMALGLIDTYGFTFQFTYKDIKELNDLAQNNESEIVKISYGNFLHVADNYLLLNSGSALGYKCGPLIVAKNELKIQENLKVAIPGQNTTANLLLNYIHPQLSRKKEIVFSEIENAVINESVDLGLIIHENRFTYRDKGLIKIDDLGENWENKTGFPIPLGGIVASRSLAESDLHQIERIIRESILYAIKKPEDIMDYITTHSQEMDANICQQHIDLYVNEYSIDLGLNGREAIKTLFRVQNKNYKEIEKKYRLWL